MRANAGRCGAFFAVSAWRMTALPQIQALRNVHEGRVAAPQNVAGRDNGAVFWLQLPLLRRLSTGKHNIWG